jgi:hypothetical protein
MRNYSALRRSEEGVALGEGIASLEPPGAEEGGKGHLGGRAGWRARATADRARRHQMTQVALRRSVGGGTVQIEGAPIPAAYPILPNSEQTL